MSLSGIKNRRQPTIFGKDLNVLIGDTTISGDLTILGSINGTSSQGQNTNNTWTGTNTYSVERPTCDVEAVGANDGVIYTQLQDAVTSNSVVNSGGNFTGTNTFSQPVTLNELKVPANPTEAISGNYLIGEWTAKGLSYLSANNVWTGVSNTFQNSIPTALEPSANTSVATKNYTDTAVGSTAVGLATSIASTIALSNVNWGSYRAVEIQIIGGGGGSTSSVGTCVCSSAGVSGGSGSQASIIILTSTALTATTNLATYSILVGGGGKAGSGCGTEASSGAGGATTLSYTLTASGYTTGTDANILRANGGGGFNGFCGQSGSTSGGTYSNINTKITISPLTSSNGKGGSQCAGTILQPYGYSTYGAGGRGATCANGVAGNAGGYTITYYD